MNYTRIKYYLYESVCIIYIKEKLCYNLTWRLKQILKHANILFINIFLEIFCLELQLILISFSLSTSMSGGMILNSELQIY